MYTLSAGSLFHLLTAVKAQTAEPTTHIVLLQVDMYHPWNMNLTLQLLHETVQDENVVHFL